MTFLTGLSDIPRKLCFDPFVDRRKYALVHLRLEIRQSSPINDCIELRPLA